MESFMMFAWIASAGFSAFIAHEKNRSVLGWALLGLFFGFFALLALIAVGKKEKQAAVEYFSEIDDAEVVEEITSFNAVDFDERLQKAKTKAGM
jgi:hypothetical protein